MNRTSIDRGTPSLGAVAAIALVTLAATFLSGCGTQGPTRDPTNAESYRGILTYPERMTPLAAGGYAREWFDPATDFSQYKRFAIERIRVQLDEKSSSVDPNDLKAMTDYFHEALKKSLEPKYPVVNEVGADVLRVRITLVDLVATKPEVSLAVLVIPYASVPDLAVSAGSGGPAGSAPYLGRTGIAVEFIDGGTNAVVGQYADENYGRKFVIDAADASKTVSGSIDAYGKSFSTWAYAQAAFDRWAQLFRQRLDAASARKR